MNRIQYDERLERVTKENFSNHIAEVIELGEMTKIIWAEPGTSNWRMEFLIDGSVLFVTGDLGYSIYNWYGSKVHPEWLGGLNIGYFLEKRMASESRSKIFHGEIAMIEAEEYLEDMFGDFSDEEDEEAREDYQERLDLLHREGRVYNAVDWEYFYSEYSQKVFGDDEGSMYKAGFMLCVRDIAPMIALRLISKQIEEK